MSRAIKRLRRVWSALGTHDPLWAILSNPDKRRGGWNLDEFFHSGELEISALETYFPYFDRPRLRRVALDFGCGVGRVTRALASRFEKAFGVDVSPSMLAKARDWNADKDNLIFIENVASDLSVVETASVDLVYSNIVLQHMPADLQRDYINEFFRILTPGGMAVFQLVCDYDTSWRGQALRWLPNALLNPLRRWVYDSRAVFEMHVLTEVQVLAQIATAGLRLLHAENYASAGSGFISRRFFVAHNEP